MHAVILHENGRIDAELLAALVQRSRMIYQAGGVPSKYTILELCETQTAAGETAQRMRKDRRERMQQSRADGGAA